MPALYARYGYYNNDCTIDAYGNQSCGTSAWSRWVRWLVLGLIIGGAILLFFACSCFSARRRRRMGSQPYRGTGWALGRMHGTPQYTNQPPQQEPYYSAPQQPPPPAYGSHPTHGNAGYYGQNVQQPEPAYGGQYGAYEPPKEAPPSRI